MPQISKRVATPRRYGTITAPTVPKASGYPFYDLDLFAVQNQIGLVGSNNKFSHEGNLRMVSTSLKVMQKQRSEIRKWVDSYARYADGYETFVGHWKQIRVGVPLQFRLFVEQIFYDMGDPWWNLVTGFKPVGQAKPR